MKLRDYQHEAVESVAKAFRSGHKRIVLQLGPGSGKSVICAEMCRKALKRYEKILVLCHQQEILLQNREAFCQLNNSKVRTSLFCNGLGEKSTRGSVIFAHRDSYSKLEEKPKIKFVIVDEAHMVSQLGTSKYQRIFKESESEYIVGLTATPFRLQGGKIYGPRKPFEIRSYNLGIKELIKRGGLCDYKIFDLDPLVRIKGKGEPDYEELGAKASQDKELTESCRLIRKFMSDRTCTIIYCCSRLHAKKVQEALGECEYIDGETPQKERAELIERMREGKVRYVTNVNVLTTGTDIPVCDGIVMLRPTLSASLYVQAIGRALRVHPNKKKAHVLELTDNLIRFGNLDDPMEYGNEREIEQLPIGEDSPEKECPSCGWTVSAPTRVCQHCDYMFLKPRELVDDAKNKQELEVYDFNYLWETTKAGDKVVVVYFDTNKGLVKEWLNINNNHKWIAMQAKAKWKKIRTQEINRIIVSNLDSQYPKVLSYHT